jgi:hypothetical protein
MIAEIADTITHPHPSFLLKWGRDPMIAEMAWLWPIRAAD